MRRRLPQSRVLLRVKPPSEGWEKLDSTPMLCLRMVNLSDGNDHLNGLPHLP